MVMMMMMDCRYQEFRPFTVSGHEGLSISQGTLYAKERFHLIIKWELGDTIVKWVVDGM